MCHYTQLCFQCDSKILLMNLSVASFSRGLGGTAGGPGGPQALSRACKQHSRALRRRGNEGQILFLQTARGDTKPSVE